MTEGIEDVTRSAADVMNEKDSHGAGMVVKGARCMRVLPGRVVVEQVARKSIIITRDDSDEDQKYYRGKVLSMGPPGVTPRACREDGTWHGGHEVPWGFKVGDEILFEPTIWLDRMRTFEFFGVKGRVWVVGQVEVLAVVE